MKFHQKPTENQKFAACGPKKPEILAMYFLPWASFSKPAGLRPKPSSFPGGGALNPNVFPGGGP